VQNALVSGLKIVGICSVVVLGWRSMYPCRVVPMTFVSRGNHKLVLLFQVVQVDFFEIKWALQFFVCCFIALLSGCT